MASKTIIGSEKESITTSGLHASDIKEPIKNKPRDAIRVRPTMEQAKINMSPDRKDHESTKQETSESRQEHAINESIHGIKCSGSSKQAKPPAKQVRSGQVKRNQSEAKSQFETTEYRPPVCLKKQKCSQKQARNHNSNTKPSKHSTSKPTLIRITFTNKRERKDIQMFLCHWLIVLVDEIKETEIDDTESTTTVTVHFPSKQTAERALKELPNGEEEYTVKMVAEVNTDVEVVQSHLLSAFKTEKKEKVNPESITSDVVYTIPSKKTTEKALLGSKEEYTVNTDIEVVQSHLSSEIESLQNWADLKQKHYLDNHVKEVRALEENLSKLQVKKHRSLEEHERVCKEREVLSLKIEERQQQRQEFEHYINTQLSLLSSLMSKESLQAKLESVKAHLLREFFRFSAALPIYAKRSQIIETICSHQVTVLVGETGSGKSTQVVQYLYEAGMAEHGFIVCTQPRKVAAITLAKHVCREMKIELGNELGYRVGMNAMCSKATRIFYMTDHALLNECIKNKALSCYSCVLIDEAHERSINTDMLLAFIKQCLPYRTDLKVVIMSATIEPELFVRYFQDEKCVTSVSTLMVSGRTFPVEVQYNSPQPLSSESSYVMNAVHIVKKIHSTEPPGSILVFLTCAPEIERACRVMEAFGNSVVVLPLHGRLPASEQQKVFEEYSRKRKIIFSTNVAETSVTIPDVKYVVDTGLAKEMQFDSQKNIDSLEVRLISKSSAEQRKGRAGRVSAGKCYRLYSSEEYISKMPDRTKPEILRIQLSQVVLKMLEFGVPDVLTFDFVEHPDRTALEAAVETLKFVGAVRDNALTDVGKKMALLPLNPQLAKVLLDGVDIGLGTEALISVAISSLAGQVFFRGGTDEMKQESDKEKLNFCHPMGDQMTNLSVYRHWQEQEKNNRNQWCVKKYVNAKSMRIVEDTAKELGHILKQRLKVNLPLMLESLDAADSYLGKLYFDAFLNNLAVYLGHEQAGYLTINDTNTAFVLFPGSSLKQLSSTPKYVIYEKTLKTSHHFLTQVMCVKQEWVNEAVEMGRLSEDPAETFKDLILRPIHVIEVGPQTYTEMAKQRNEILEMVKVNIPQYAISPVMDFFTTPKQWGIVRALSQHKSCDAVRLVVTQCVKEKQAEFKEEKKEFGITKEQDSTRVVVGAGGTVQQVILPFYFRTVVAVSSNKGEWLDRLKHQMQTYGKVEKMQEKQCNNDFRLIVTYCTSDAAQRAMSKCKYPSVSLRPWRSQQFTLKIQWERRQRGPFAFLSFDSQQHCDCAHGKLTNLARVGIRVSPDKHSRSKLFLSGNTLCSIDEDNLRNKILHRVGECINFYLKMGYKKYVEQNAKWSNRDKSDSSNDEDEHRSKTEGDSNNESSPQEYLNEELMDIITNHTKLGTYSLKFETPHQQAIFFKAYVTFDDPNEGYRVLNSDLKKVCIDGKPISVSPDLKCTLFFRREIFTLIQKNLDETRRELIQGFCNVLRIKITPPNKENKDFARISIFSDDVKAFSVAQNKLNSASQPLVLDCKTTELQEYILTQTCCKELESIQGNTSTYMCRDINTMCIKVYGMEENQAKAKAMVTDKAKELFSGGATVVEMSLGGNENPPGLMKRLVTRYGYNLEGMLEIEGIRRIGLNPRRQVISLLATAVGQNAVRACIEEHSQVTVNKLEAEYEVDCSICFTPIEEPKDLTRLECCGHAFHTKCIAIQMKPDTLTLPVLCARERCGQEFLLRDFRNLQKQLEFRMRDLVTAALQKFMEHNGDKYKNCPTPDCKMIYAITDDGQPFNCSNCTVSTCTKCNEQYHAGISCEVYKNNRKTEEEILEWIKEDPNNRKKCPKCSCAIEKNGGCMHMECKCGAHICWRCLKHFKTSQMFDSHQAVCPAIKVHANIPARPAPPVNHPARPAPQFNIPARPSPPVNHPARPAPQFNIPARPSPPVNYPARPAPQFNIPARPSPPVNYPARPAPQFNIPARPSPPVNYPARPAPQFNIPARPAPPINNPARPAPQFTISARPSPPTNTLAGPRTATHNPSSCT